MEILVFIWPYRHRAGMSLTYNCRPQVEVLGFELEGQHRAIFTDGLVDWRCAGCGWTIPDGDEALRAHMRRCAKPWPQYMRA